MSASRRRGMTVLRASWMFEGTGSALIADPVLTFADGVITGVGTDLPPAAGAIVVDLPGATLLPGLVDAHVHLAFDAGPDPVASLAARSDDEVTAAMTAAGRAALAGGVTTVRDLGDRDFLSLALRGTAGLPTIVAAGPPITTPGGHCHFLGGAVEPTVAGIRRAVREHADRGVDVIKVMASGGTMTPGSRQELAQFEPEVLAAAVGEAHRLGLPVTAHAHAVPAIVDAVAAGIDGIEHCSFWTADGNDAGDEQIASIAAAGIVVSATLGMVPVPGVSPPAEVMRRLPQMMMNLGRMRAAGVRMVVGTDAGIGPVKPHDVLRAAPKMLQTIGFGAAESLRAVTSTAADALRLGQTKGRLAPGFDADVLAVDGDPIADPAALQRIRAVYAGGVAVDR